MNDRRRGTRDRAAEQLLVLRCQLRRDERAFEQLFRLYHDSLLYYLRRLTADLQASEDLLQSVWLQVNRKIATLKDPAAFRSWLFRIGHNQAVQRFRETVTEVPIEEVQGPAEAEEELRFSEGDAALVHSALTRLTPPHREVLTLSFLEEMSYEEIASVTGCALGTVRSRIHYAKRALQRALEEMDDGIAKRFSPQGPGQ